MTISHRSRPALVCSLTLLIALLSGHASAHAAPVTRYTRQPDALSPSDRAEELVFALDRSLVADRWPVARKLVEDVEMLGLPHAQTGEGELTGESNAAPGQLRPNPGRIVAPLVAALLCAGALTLVTFLVHRRRRGRLARALVRSVLLHRLPEPDASARVGRSAAG